VAPVAAWPSPPKAVAGLPTGTYRLRVPARLDDALDVVS